MMKSFGYAALALLVTAQSTVAMNGMGGDGGEKVGGWKNTKPTHELKELLISALTKGNANYATGVDTRLCVTQLKYLETQVVAGTNYRFHAMGCDVGSAFERVGKCAGDDANCAPSSYAITVFEQPWSNTLQVTDIFVESGPAKKLEVPAEEKVMIKQWLKKNKLNRFGDPKGTHYTGGTPLFNETTGATTNRYEYIFAHHPDHPWLPTAAPMMGMVRASPLNLAAEKAATKADSESSQDSQQRGQMSEPYIKGLATFGVFTIAVAAVAFIKARQTTTRRFTYDSVSRSDL